MLLNGFTFSHIMNLTKEKCVECKSNKQKGHAVVLDNLTNMVKNICDLGIPTYDFSLNYFSYFFQKIIIVKRCNRITCLRIKLSFTQFFFSQN